MMNTTILDDIPFKIKTESLMKRLRIEKGSSHEDDFMRLVEEALTIGKPKALYKVVYIDSKSDDHVVIDGVTLKSRVLRVNLEEVHRVFPFVATCGKELEDWARSMDDILLRFWAESINEVVIRLAVKAMDENIDEQYRPGDRSRMTPGSLPDWPIEEQQTLFKILGNTKDTIGVYLTDGLMMIPTKSVSGISFPTEWDFESCQLCPREKCPGRRAPYDKDLYDKRYRPISSIEDH